MFKNLFRRRQELAPKPTLTFELDITTGVVTTRVHFPKPVNEQEGERMAINFGVMAYLLNEGRFLPILQQAIALGGAACGQQDVAQIALESLTEMLRIAARQEVESERPVIQPIEVFTGGGQ